MVDAASIFRYSHRVTYAECTVGNHVYHARYLDLLEAARGEFFRELGFPLLSLQEHDAVFPVIECRLQFKAPARYDDRLEIYVWITELAGVRLGFSYRILNQAEELLVEGTTRHVCTGMAGKPKRLPKDLIEALRPHLRIVEKQPQ
jgi:acyl-CoA thioester hydrolase